MGFVFLEYYTSQSIRTVRPYWVYDFVQKCAIYYSFRDNLVFHFTVLLYNSHEQGKDRSRRKRRPSPSTVATWAVSRRLVSFVG